MAIRLKAFIDSNVLANWMLIEAAVQEIGASAHSVLKEIAGRKYPSYTFLEAVRNSNESTPVEFGTSGFAVAETIRVILDDLISRTMYEKGIPYSYWESAIKEQRLSQRDQEALFKQVEHFLTVFCAESNMLLTWYTDHDLTAVHNLITSTRVSTTDAYLVGQAICGECTYFITEDRALRRLLKKGKKIQAFSAQAALGLFS